MTRRLHTAQVLSSWCVVEVEGGRVTQYFPVPLPDREAALVFRAFIELYRQTSYVDAPVDLLRAVAVALCEFLEPVRDVRLGDVMNPEETLRAWLESASGKAALAVCA